MDRYKRKFVKNAVIIPLIAAVVTTALFFALESTFESDFSFLSNDTALSDYEKEQTVTAEKIDFSNGDIKKSDIPAYASNTILGSVTADYGTMELIYDANEVNAVGRMNVSFDGKLAGQTGAMVCTCYKADAKFVKSLKTGDTVDVDFPYGKYTYTAVKTSKADSLGNAAKQADGIGRAMVICVDDGDGVGISDNYLAVVCEMTDGNAVIG